MKRFYNLCFAAFCVLALGMGCSSAPAPVPEEIPAPPEPAVVMPPSAEIPPELMDMRASVEAMRQKNVQYGFDVSDPDIWGQAEADSKAAASLYGNDNAESLRLYSDALKKYTELYESGLRKLNDELVSSITSSRDAAIAAGADTFFPDEFAFADAEREALSLLSEDPEAFNAAGASVLLRYQTLEQAGLALSLLQRIDTLNFAAMDQAEYDAGIAALGQTSALYTERGRELDAFNAASSARELFGSVIDNGFRVLADEERVKADNTKAQADSIKANVSLKDRYAAALSLYKDAAAAYQDGDNERAYNGFVSASSAFTSVYQDALIKRNAAWQAMEDARKKADDTNAFAEEADVVAPLPDEEEAPPAAPVKPAETTESAETSETSETSEPAQSAETAGAIQESGALQGDQPSAATPAAVSDTVSAREPSVDVPAETPPPADVQSAGGESGAVPADSAAAEGGM